MLHLSFPAFRLLQLLALCWMLSSVRLYIGCHAVRRGALGTMKISDAGAASLVPVIRVDSKA